jgi:type II secretory pathway component PulF
MDFSQEALSGLGAKVAYKVKRWQFGTKLQLGFLEDLNLLISDGIPANRAIEMMSQVSTGLTREVALSLSEKIGEGKPLAEGMQDWFAMNVIEIVRVGEAGGALGQTIQSAIKMLSQRGVAVGAFIGALSYPLMVIAMACGIIIYLNTSVFTQFRLIKPIEQWPSAGQQLVFIAGIIQHWWLVVILAVIGLIILLRYLMANYVGELRPMLDKAPPFSFYKRFASGRLLETLGLLVANGVVFKSAIKVLQYLESHLIMMDHLLSMGKTNIAEVLDTGLVSDSDLMRLRVMAEVKGFEHGLARMGIRGTEEATATIKLLSKISGGILLAVGAGLIIAIVRGVFSTGMAMGS